jgi:hypothetical protein
MQYLMPTLVKNAQRQSERAALHAYMSAAVTVSMASDSLRIALTRELAPRQHRVIFALEAMRNPKMNYAREALVQLGSTPERELLEAVRRVGADELPVSLPDFMLLDARKLPWTVLDALSRLDERFQYVRAQATLALAEHRATPDSVLQFLALGLRSHRDPALAERLFARAITDTSRALLRVISALDSVRYGTTPARARDRMTTLDTRVPASEARLLPPRTLPTPAISDSNQDDSWMSADQCLTADEWSEQLRLAIDDTATLIAGRSLCIRAAAVLDSAFELAPYDSVYVFRVSDGWALAMPPKRSNADAIVIRFDTAFVERSRQVVRVY